MKVKSESEVAQLYPTLSDPMTAAHQAPLSMGVSRQEYYKFLTIKFEIFAMSFIFLLLFLRKGENQA